LFFKAGVVVIQLNVMSLSQFAKFQTPVFEQQGHPQLTL